MTRRTQPLWLVGCYAGAIFASAFLLFQVQPVISKTILPWFGGSPAVWTTCMLLFQVLLFAGYAYAHFSIHVMRPTTQGVVHLMLIFVALAVLPITPDASWKPTDGEHPTLRILLLLTANVGLPYFLLSSTGPLLQTWFSYSFAGRSPYRLYALSNVGSLLALLSYPLLVEPALTTRDQGVLWTVGFSGFALLCGFCTWRIWQQRAGFDRIEERQAGHHAEAGHQDRTREAGTDRETDNTPPRFGRRVAWLLLPALASVLLLAVTNHVCQDVAVIPFLWVAPLSLYLLSFIICFDSERWYSRRWFALGAVASIVGISVRMMWHAADYLLLDIGIYFTALFLACMICHGELVRRKPSPRYLTSFYLMCSAGGALGGILVVAVCPYLFSNYFELNLSLLLTFFLAIGVLLADAGPTWFAARPRCRPVVGVAVFLAVLATVKAQFAAAPPRDRLAVARNFYGVLSVMETGQDDPRTHGRMLVHGRTIHGHEYQTPERRTIPTKYYTRASGVGIVLRRVPRQGAIRVGVIGLGVGTLANYGRPGDYFRFYEINPDVVRMARSYFRSLEVSAAEIDVVVGDGRLSMEREPPQEFDVLVIDAFTSDAIPAHLLTREAFEVYRRHLKPDGAMAVNISNHYLDLVPVVAPLAERTGWQVGQVIAAPEPGNPAASASHWIVATSNRMLLEDDELSAAFRAAPLPKSHIPLWTDDYNNLFQILK